MTTNDSVTRSNGASGDRYSPNYNPGRGATNPSLKQIRGGMSSTSTISKEGVEQKAAPSKTENLAVKSEQNRLYEKYAGYVAADQQLQRDNIARNISESPVGSPISPSNRVTTKPETYQSYSGPRPSEGDPLGLGAAMGSPGYVERNTAGYVNYPAAFGGGQYTVKQQEAINRGYTGYMGTAFGGGMGGENIPGTQSIAQAGGEKLFDRAAQRRAMGEGVQQSDYTGAREGLKMFGLEKVGNVKEGETVNILVGEKSFPTADAANDYLKANNQSNINQYREDEAQNWRELGLYERQEKTLTSGLVPIVEGFNIVGQYTGRGFNVKAQEIKETQQTTSESGIRVSTIPGIFNLASPVVSSSSGSSQQPSTFNKGVLWLGKQTLPLSGYLGGRDMTLATTSPAEIIPYGINVGTIIGGGGEVVAGAKTAGAALVGLGKFGVSWVTSFETAKFAEKTIPGEGIPKTIAVVGVSMLAGGLTYRALGGTPAPPVKQLESNIKFETSMPESKILGEVKLSPGRETFEIVGNVIEPKPVQVNVASTTQIIGEGSFTGSGASAGTANYPLKMGAYLKGSKDVAVNPVIESFSENSVLSGKGFSSGIQNEISVSSGSPIAKNVFTSQADTLTDTVTKTYGGNVENLGIERLVQSRGVLSPGASVGKQYFGTLTKETMDVYGTQTGKILSGKNVLNIQSSGNIIEGRTMGETFIRSADVNAVSATKVGVYSDVINIQPEISAGRYSATRMGSGVIGTLEKPIAEVKYSQALEVYPDVSNVKSFEAISFKGGQSKTSLNDIYKPDVKTSSQAKSIIDNILSKTSSPYNAPLSSDVGFKSYRVSGYSSMVTDVSQSYSSIRYGGGKSFVADMVSRGLGGSGRVFSLSGLQNFMGRVPRNVQASNNFMAVAQTQNNFRVSDNIIKQALGTTQKRNNMQLNNFMSAQSQITTSMQTNNQMIAQLTGLNSKQAQMQQPLQAQMSITPVAPVLPGMNTYTTPSEPNTITFPWNYASGGAFYPGGSPPTGGGGGSRGFRGFNKKWWKQFNPFLSSSEALNMNIGGF